MRSRARILATALLLAACSGGHQGIRSADAASYGGYESIGLASWYGDELAGSRTASGARFDPRAITAAHRSLPLGSFVEVTSLDTGRSIVALVNDRGPGRKDRVIDLSRAAAQQLGFGTHSVARVRLRAITPSAEDATALRSGRPAPLRFSPNRASAPDVAESTAMPAALDPARRYQLQVASFSSEARARALAAALPPVLDADVFASGSLWRVRIGPMSSVQVERARDAVVARGYGDAQILPAN